MVSFPHVSPPEACAHLSPPPLNNTEFNDNRLIYCLNLRKGVAQIFSFFFFYFFWICRELWYSKKNF